jgi:hypothetical protein
VIFAVCARVDNRSIKSSMGAAEYSYFFVLQRYIPVLGKLGKVVLISDPELQLDDVFRTAKMMNEKCVFLQFSPPHKAYTKTNHPSLCVFAWEFTTIPTDSWGNDVSNDWRTTLTSHQAAITHSSMAVTAVKDAMGSDLIS